MLASRVLSKGSGKARRLVVSAAAKVNLALEVLSRRPDGYHEIATVMHAVDLSDRLVLEEADGLEVRITAPGVPTDERNLAHRAAAVPARNQPSGCLRRRRCTLWVREARRFGGG